jgi:hypothetical protein
MLFPFFGLFVSLAIWGTFYPVPGFIRPSDGFVRRLSGAFKATTCAGQIYRVIEMTRMHAGPGHKDPESYFQGVPFGGFEEYICLVNGTEAIASVVIPLGEETVEQPVVDGRNNTELVVAFGSDEGCVVESRYTGGDSTVSISSLCPRATAWAFAWWYLAVIICFCLGLVPYGAHARDAVERLGQYFEPSPKVARLLVVDSGSLSHLDFLYNTFTSSSSSGLPLEGEADDVVSIHHMVEKAITRLERQRAVAVSPELEYCITKSWTVGPGGAVEPPTNPVPVTSSVVLGQSDAHQPWQRWALVVHRPEDHNVVYQRVCSLLAIWRHTVEMAVPVLEEHPGETVPVPEDVAAPEGRRKRKNRASQAQRRRQGKRREREEKERQEGQAPALG